MNDSKEINKLKEKEYKFSDIESDNNINIIIIKKKFEFEFITEENIKFKGVFFEDEKLSKVRKICKIKDKYLFTDKNGENINKEEEDSVTLNDLFFNNTIILKSKDKEIKNHSKIDSKIDSKFDSKNDSKIQGNYLKTINNFSIFLYKQEEKFNEKELKNSKTIIMVGETGSGKTTMLNCLTNYLMGVKLSDRFRYFLVDEPERIDNSHSQTSNVNIYYIRSKTNYIPNLRIIDTPGYGDTRGIEYDKKITNMIKEKFEKEIKSINSICFVAKSDKVRFTYEQNYVFNEVFSLFGKDITDNFIFLFTFCDNKEPLIINSLKYNEPFKSFIPKIKQPWYLKFNNSGFFQNPNELFAKTFFQIGEESFRQFLDKLKILPNKKVNVEQILSVKNENNINIQNLEIEVKNLLKSINNISILIAIMEKNSKKFEEYSNGVFGNNSYSSPNYANYNNKCIIYLPSDIIDYYCNTCRQICLKNHHKNYQFKCQKAGCNHYYQTQHSEKNTREIEQSKIKNTVKSINDIYLSTLNTYATLTILLKDLKLELEKIQIETLEKFEDLDYLKNKNSSKPYDFYDSLKKKYQMKKKKVMIWEIYSLFH